MGYDPRLPGARRHATVRATATTSEASSDFAVKTISWLRNKGAVAITFNIDAATTASGAFVLEPGDEIEDWDKAADTLSYKTASGTAAFEAAGLLS